METKTQEPFWTEADLISAYTRAQALEDGVLIDVSETAMEAGIRHPVAVTCRVWHELIVPDDRSRSYGQSEEGRLWDVLWMLVIHARAQITRNPSEIRFQVKVIMKERQPRLISLKAVSGPGDNGKPVVTIMREDES